MYSLLPPISPPTPLSVHGLPLKTAGRAGKVESGHQMVCTHTCESAGVLENVKVNGQSRPAKLSGILLNLAYHSG